ncbi:MAG: hypothetical protein LC667_06315 [Thioalkalivibrio sp.]|nr:hypothetical protein [Thioalkalivibrio sp.]
MMLLTTGFWLIFGRYGGMGNVGAHVHWMLLIGLIMLPSYSHIFFALTAHAPSNRGPGLTAGWPPSRADPRIHRD